MYSIRLPSGRQGGARNSLRAGPLWLWRGPKDNDTSQGCQPRCGRWRRGPGEGTLPAPEVAAKRQGGDVTEDPGLGVDTPEDAVKFEAALG